MGGEAGAGEGKAQRGDVEQRWVEVTPTQFPHEAEGLHLIQDLLPDEPPFRAWSNFEFRDSQGKWHEIDLVVLGRKRMHLVELKYYYGTLRGDDHVWRRDGKPAEDSPLKLARRKAQRLASKLKDELRRLAQESGTTHPGPADGHAIRAGVGLPAPPELQVPTAHGVPTGPIRSGRVQRHRAAPRDQ